MKKITPLDESLSQPGEKPKILLIDDSAVDLGLLIQMMATRDMRITVAFNGQDGYDKALLQRPDLILLDVVMPRMDGFTACRLLKTNELTRYIPVIFLSAANELTKRLEGLSLGAVDFICKPFSEQEVIAKVEIHLNLARQLYTKNTTEATQTDDNSLFPSKDALLIHATINYLRENLRHPPSTETLAKTLGTNEKRLNQAFQTAFAMSVFEWLREERLRQARDLVTLTETSFVSISDHLGYCSPSNFSRAFRERFGCSARELRKSVQRTGTLSGAS